MKEELDTEKAHWLQEIRELRETTKSSHQNQRPVAFYGSSSIRMWQSLKQDLLPITAVNLGFGGSSYYWCNYFFEDVFEFVKPSKVVLYAGDNDLGNAVSEIEIINSVEQLLEKIEVKFGNIPVAIISVKPSPDRSYLDDKIKNLNGQLLKIMRERARGSFINIYAEMLHPNGAMRPELYEPDGLHINTKGYEIWAKVIKHHLLEQA